MVNIASDTLEISQSLKELIDLCEKSGAHFNPDLTIQYENSDFSITCEKPTNGRLAYLKSDSLIPVNSEHFSLENDHLVVNTHADTGWNSLQEDIAQTMLSIFNRGDKIKQFKKHSFWLTMPEKNELCSHISAAKMFNQSDERFLDKKKSQHQQDQVVINGFFNSRVLGLSKDNNHSQRVIMPVIDYMNHHWRGAPYNYRTADTPGFLSVQCAQPDPDSNECFAFYNTMDALDSYVKYGFPDLSSPLVRSVPLEINIDNVGKIQILGAIAKSAQGQSLKAFKNIPRQVPLLGDVVEGKHIKVSHIFIPGPNTPFAMKRILSALVRRLSLKELSEDSLRSIVSNCEEQIIEANIAYYKKLETIADSQILRELSISQLSKIDRYVRLTRFS